MTFDSVNDWLMAFRADPETLLARLFNGTDQIFPYFRDANGAQLIWYILPRKSEPDPHGDIPRVDRALPALLQTCVQRQASPDNWNIGANRAAQIIDLLSVMHLPVTAQWVRDNLELVKLWVAACTRPTSRDLSVALSRVLYSYKETPDAP